MEIRSRIYSNIMYVTMSGELDENNDYYKPSKDMPIVSICKKLMAVVIGLT